MAAADHRIPYTRRCSDRPPCTVVLVPSYRTVEEPLHTPAEAQSHISACSERQTLHLFLRDKGGFHARKESTTGAGVSKKITQPFTCRFFLYMPTYPSVFLMSISNLECPSLALGPRLFFSS